MARQAKKPRQTGHSRMTGSTQSQTDRGIRSRNHKEGRFYHRKGLAIVVVVALMAGVASVVVAISLTTLESERISLFQGETTSSHFDVTTHQLGFQGPVQVVFTVTLTNTDTDPHMADVTAQILDSDQDVVLELTKSTGEVTGGDSVTLTYVFVNAGLANDFDSTFLVVRDEA